MNKFFLLGCFLSAGAMAIAQSIDEKTQGISSSLALPPNTPIEGGRFPIYDDEGYVTSQIFSDFAYVMTNGNIEIRGLRIETYAYENGKRLPDPEMTITSPECYYNESKRQIVGEKEIRISRTDFVVTGTGFLFNADAKELRILSGARVVAQSARK